MRSEPPASAASAAAKPALLDSVRALAQELHHAALERLNLFALEARQAAHAAVQMVVLAVAAGLLLASAWLALIAGIFLGLVAWGLPWGAALALAFVANLVGVGVILQRARRLSESLMFPATLRTLKSHAVGKGDAAPAAGSVASGSGGAGA